MRRSQSRTRQILFILLSCLMLGGFVVAQTMPLKRWPVGVRSSFSSSATTLQVQLPEPSPIASQSPVASSVLSASPVLTPAPVSRDLSQYENGGTISMSTAVGEATRSAVLSQTREFILRKWNERGLGRIV